MIPSRIDLELLDSAERERRIGGQYELGTGGYHQTDLPVNDLPWTETADGRHGADCAGFALSWCYRIPRHRPGYNVGWHDPDGRTPSVEDDLNCDSALEDADHLKDLFVRATGSARPGDLLVYPTIRLPNYTGRVWIGHVAIVTTVDPAFDLTRPDYSLLAVAQCCGPEGRSPAVIASDGSIWNHHDHLWPLPQHRTVVLRAQPR